VNDTELASLASHPKRALDRSHEVLRAQRGQISPDAERDVTGSVLRRGDAPQMRNPRSGTRLAPRAGPSPAPTRDGSEIELDLRGSRHRT
jgi:hypothetical protein